MKFFFFTLVIFLSQMSFAKKTIVLVPGFLNLAGAQYFSPAIVKTLKESGFDVHVVDRLNPIGDFRENGQILLNYLGHLESVKKRKLEFYLIGHSAGGIYSLYAAHARRYNIKKIATISTPFNGVNLTNTVVETIRGSEQLAQLINLDSFVQFTTANTRAFLSRIRLPQETEIITYGGSQKLGLDSYDVRNISGLLRVPHLLMRGLNDGLVSFSSAHAVNTLKTVQNRKARVRSHIMQLVPLDHIEQVADYKSFVFEGYKNAEYILSQQRYFYTRIAIEFYRD